MRTPTNIRYALLVLLLVIASCSSFAQNSILTGTITSEKGPVSFANVSIPELQKGMTADEEGYYELADIAVGKYTLLVSSIGYSQQSVSFEISNKEPKRMDVRLEPKAGSLDEVVVTGTMKEVSKLDSPVTVEVYTSKFFLANPTPSIFESMQNVNGVRPQLNCNVCNTGDIHINGLEGPYTMVLIDGMPIVSGLSTVYGLTGIPQSLIERVEIVKGPASTLYGSEAVGGLVNIITKKPNSAPLASVDVFSTNWGEINTDIGVKFKVGSAQSLLGVNYFNYQNPIDNNADGFTDVTLQNRFSVFNKISFDRHSNRVFTLAGRYVYEDRWGGEMNWNPTYRGGDEVYGESIYTKRWEAFGTYQLPSTENLMLQFSANGHNQNSVYGDLSFTAQQYVTFAQVTWNKQLINKHDILMGMAFRSTFYDDNTAATAEFDNPSNTIPSVINLPGAFIQDEVKLNTQNTLLLGVRYDYNSVHGAVASPRVNYKYASKDKSNILRISVGNGYRVANVFTEDHAALTGARQLVFEDELNPETSWNGNINFVKKTFTNNGTYLGLDATAFYTYFTNRIIPDYETDPNKIIYGNLDGHSSSQGLSLNLDVEFSNGLKLLAGSTLQDVNFTDEGVKQRQLLTEGWSGVWSANYTFKKAGLSIDYTGNIYGPMLLPLLGPLDNRPSESPVFSIQNIQLTKYFQSGLEMYGGVKNLLNYTPPSNSIARSFDPFDRGVDFDANGQAIATPSNPNALTFDPTYVFAPNQGIRGFFGMRYTLK